MKAKMKALKANKIRHIFDIFIWDVDHPRSVVSMISKIYNVEKITQFC